MLIKNSLKGCVLGYFQSNLVISMTGIYFEKNTDHLKLLCDWQYFLNQVRAKPG
jgi:hypothetical protein